MRIEELKQGVKVYTGTGEVGLKVLKHLKGLRFAGPDDFSPNTRNKEEAFLLIGGNQYKEVCDNYEYFRNLPYREATCAEILNVLPPKENLKPFQRVLCRDSSGEAWECSFYSRFIPETGIHVVVNAKRCKYCISYEGNERLLGTINDPC